MWAVRLQSVRPVGPTIVPCKRPVTKPMSIPPAVVASNTKYCNMCSQRQKCIISLSHPKYADTVDFKDTIFTALLCTVKQWRRSVVKYRSQGQSGQAIKLFQITPYVNDFQTLNNPGPWQPVGASKIGFTFYFWHKSFILDDLKLAELSDYSFEWKNVTFLGWRRVKTYSDPPTYSQASKTPTPDDLRPRCEILLLYRPRSRLAFERFFLAARAYDTSQHLAASILVINSFLKICCVRYCNYC